MRVIYVEKCARETLEAVGNNAWWNLRIAVGTFLWDKIRGVVVEAMGRA